MYEHGLQVREETTEVSSSTSVSMAAVVIGTAPVHMTNNPGAVTNTPVLCNNISECRSKLGYSTAFDKYTLCQSMYMSFLVFGVAPIVFINVLDVTKHKKSVESKSYSVNNNSIVINDDVILSSLVIKKESAEIDASKYETAWNDGKLTVNFTDTTTGAVTVTYDAADPTAVTESDIIGAYNTTTEKRTGMEVIHDVYPKTGVVPMLLLCPKYSENDTVGSMLDAKTTNISGTLGAFALLDIAAPAGTTRAAAIKERKSRTGGENSEFFFPYVKRGDYIFSYSAYAAALIMYRAAARGNVFCEGVDNQALNIDDCVLADGTSVYYNQPDGNELVGEGITTIIARNGFYAWGNNTAAYPTITAPQSRWVNMRLAFIYAENDFIARNANRDIDIRTLEDLLTDENIKLSAWAANGYITSGSMTFNAADNTADDISSGRFTLRTNLTPNAKAEVITNIFKFDKDALTAAIAAQAGGIE
ncbi:MAG: hypothetical protein ACI4EA_04495 [Candidatus Ornithomonoglobus sp.]